MSVEWETWKINGGFMRPSGKTFEMRLVDMETLQKCRTGLNKHIRSASGDKRRKLKMIKEEIEFLINNL